MVKVAERSKQLFRRSMVSLASCEVLFCPVVCLDMNIQITGMPVIHRKETFSTITNYKEWALTYSKHLCNDETTSFQ